MKTLKVEQVYKAKRLHSALGSRSPEGYEILIARQAAWFDGLPWPSAWGSFH